MNRAIQVLRTGDPKDAALLLVGIFALAVNVLGLAVVLS